jgi:hypothetical protein
MPPRRSARVAAVAERATTALSPLPLPLVLHIFSLLPADARARAACVCRGWRVTLDELSLGRRLDLSPSSGVRVRVMDAVLAGAARKARAQLATLDLFECDDVTFNVMLAVVRANGGALHKLRGGVHDDDNVAQTLNAVRVTQLVLAAPQLRALNAYVLGAVDIADARRMLRNEPPFQPLRLCELRVFCEGGADDASV